MLSKGKLSYNIYDTQTVLKFFLRLSIVGSNRRLKKRRKQEKKETGIKLTESRKHQICTNFVK